MAIQTIRLTPHADPTPAVVEVERELSGAQWCARFPRSDSIVTLRPSFQLAVSSFLWALQQAGASYTIHNTFRPLEACYLMRNAWLIWRGVVKPDAVKPYPGVLIEWVHETQEESVSAACRMCFGYHIQGLKDAPAAESNHSKGLAIDMSISWNGNLRINDASGEEVVIKTMPRDNLNADLWAVGATYGVKRYHSPRHDIPHWSVDGQ